MQEKSRGLLAYAINTNTVDYVGIAHATLKLASHHLGIPYTLITPDAQDSWQNYRTDIDTHAPVSWNNFDRYRCFEHSPYEQTIVIDVDYLVLTPRLNQLFAIQQDLVLCHDNRLMYQPLESGAVIDPVWATVFYFTKNKKNESFFYLAGKVQRNWEYYKNFFGIPHRQFRNDYAFAIAELITNGYAKCPATRLPWHITTVDRTPKDIEINDKWLIIRDNDKANILPRQDLHVMSKSWLQSSKLTDFIAEATK